LTCRYIGLALMSRCDTQAAICGLWCDRELHAKYCNVNSRPTCPFSMPSLAHGSAFRSHNGISNSTGHLAQGAKSRQLATCRTSRPSGRLAVCEACRAP
jgi:hypothetical protein